MLPCLFKKYVGISCMGCGLQRSILYFWEGRLYDSFEVYPPFWFFLVIFPTFCICKIFFKNIQTKYFIWLLVVIIFINYIFNLFLYNNFFI